MTVLVAVALVIGGVLQERRPAVAELETTPPSIQSSSPPIQSSSPEGTQPPLNAREVKVIAALGTLGITGQRAQLPFNEASIWADFGSGRHLFVTAYPLSTVDRNYTVIDERQVARILVQHVQRASGAISSRFECSGDEYWVAGADPPGFPNIDVFVERLVSVVCSP
ncbi:MAG: hypothetical protein E6I44_03025 [Chloroflexi bacterium]|nr:MAG: hypothetical protein E6I44_03025 [Chloroflexota bacterium]